ncbi:MAG: anaerobic ribonucleoside-triphosphate reductase activating protein [Clostridiales bacterium]|nr:anaerobic ribonucleoside-triphosphate reductase activating protein [Clostridiales bacterium]
MKFRLFGTAEDSIVDGPGIRFTVFVQGCPHHCEGCHNPESHDFAGGREAETDQIIVQMTANPLLDGLTLSGGEPMCSAQACAELARAAKAAGLNVWCYTGYTWEALVREADPDRMALLREVDVLVDGPFVLAERSLELQFCGSRNQRLLDVQKSMREGQAVLWQAKKW